MNDIDDEIRAAMKDDDVEVLTRYQGDAPIHVMVADLYRGRRRWLNISASIGTFILFGIFLYCGYAFFLAETIHAMIGWAAAFLMFFMWVILMKIWFWLELVRHSITREVKRLELQVALLNESVRGQTDS